MYIKFLFLKCDDCEKSSIQSSREKAKLNGWHFDSDGERCYCSKCAPFHRKVKATSPQKGGAVFAFGCGE